MSVIVSQGLERRRRKHACQRHECLGGSGACPGKFLKLDSLNRHFMPSLDWKWLTGKVTKNEIFELAIMIILSLHVSVFSP